LLPVHLLNLLFHDANGLVQPVRVAAHPLDLEGRKQFPGVLHWLAKRLEVAGEIQWAMQKLFWQYSAIAHLLLPTDLIPKEKAAPAKEKAKTEPQPQLNFDYERYQF
jgi:hypothetical protein